MKFFHEAGNKSVGPVVYQGGRAASIFATALIVIMTMTLSSCASLFGPKHFVPEEASAREQMRVAERQLENARTTFDPELRIVELEKGVAAFRAVVERFPNDRQFTPLAHYYWALLTQQMEHHRRAERIYRDVLRLYPDDQVVNASALFGLGETYEQLGRGAQSSETYRELIEVYGNSDNSTIRDLVAIARTRRGRVL